MLVRSAPARVLPAAILTLLLFAAALPLRGAPPAEAAGGASILLVTSSAAPNKLGGYLAEIMRAEGLPQADRVDLSALGGTALASYRLVILADAPLTAGQAAQLTAYVTGGGRLLAMRPDSQIAGLFGVTPVGTSQTDGYLAIDTATPVGAGLPGATLQIHGPATRYTLTTGVQVARLYSDAATATASPAVVTATSGSGRTAAFAYDLAASVALTRQGNPANANVDTDGDGVLRSVDLFQGAGGGSPWVDRDRISLPQADIQQRLFARLAADLLGGPVPQLWYFPDGAKTMLILTGDAHGNPTSYFQAEIDSLSGLGAPITFYLSQAADPAPAQMQTWRGQGIGFGIHPSQPIASTYPGQVSWFHIQYPQQAISRTVRNHQVAWSGWTDAAELEVASGVALDLNAYAWGRWLKRPDGTWPHGYTTGSGQAMRFVKADGTVLPIYQQLTTLVDEQLMGQITLEGFEGLNDTQALAVSRALIDSSLDRDYAALAAQFHVDYYGYMEVRRWAEGTVSYASSRGVPLWNADQWLAFLETRDAMRLQGVSWSAATGQLQFTTALASPPPQASPAKITVALPNAAETGALDSVTVDGAPASYVEQTIGGRRVAFVTLTAGAHTVVARYAGAATSTPTATPPPPVGAGYLPAVVAP